MALAQSKLGLLPSFKLCPKIGSQPVEEDQEPKEDAQKLKGKEIQHQVPDFKTPEPIIQKRETMSTRLYNWTTKPTENNDYEYLFNFKTGREYTTMRCHFLSLGEGVEMELTIMDIMCIINNRENNEKFKYTTYRVPPLFLHSILEKYGHNYVNATIGLPQDISTMTNMDPLHYIDENKMKSALFAELQQFREQYMERILYHGDNYFRHKAKKASNPVIRHAKPSTALQSPYTQSNTADLESGN
ncbi:hypothetical protein PIB30_008629 [Stylosanthes scabra]|uniref:Uncharacterized protein n=1 Tax=Stylosanthes scabra TaxID=79078 RepID=A0ABU6S549_9FABA|nr:hypothetical protein [Stylosanthes scabra]